MALARAAKPAELPHAWAICIYIYFGFLFIQPRLFGFVLGGLKQLAHKLVGVKMLRAVVGGPKIQ